MYIGTINVGTRSKPAKDSPKRWTTAAVSAAGIVTQQDYAKTEQDVELNFRLKTETLKNNVKNYLMESVRPYGKVIITPDSGDALETGATSPTEFIFLDFEADYVANQWWNFKVTVRKYN